MIILWNEKGKIFDRSIDWKVRKDDIALMISGDTEKVVLATVSWNPDGYVAEIMEGEEMGRKEIFESVESAKDWAEDVFGLRPVHIYDDYGNKGWGDDGQGGKGAVGM